MSIKPRGSKFRVWVYDPAKKRSVPIGTFDTLADAQAAEHKAEAAKGMNTFVGPSTITVEQFITDSWYPAMRIQRPGSDDWQYHGTHIIRVLGTMKLQKLGASRITQFYADLMEGEHAISAGYVHKIAKSFRNIFALASDYGIVSQNEASLARLPKQGSGVRSREAQVKKIKMWPEGELERLFDYLRGDWLTAIQENNQQFTTELRQMQMTAWYLQATTGCRQSQIIPVRWEDIDFDKAEMTISQTLIARKGGAAAQKPMPGLKSGADAQTIALFPETIAVLREHKLRWQRYSPTEGIYKGIMFCDTEGMPINPRTYSERLKSACKGAGVTPLSSHSLRHHHATTLLRQGWPLKVVSQRLGHSSVKITEIYLHFVTQDQHDAIRKSGSFLREETL